MINRDSADSEDIKLHFLDYWRVIRVRLPLIVLIFLLVVMTAAVVTYLMPREYQSAVTMQVKQGDTVMDVFNKDRSTGFDPRFVTTQFEIIQRTEILYPVIEALKLDAAWKARYGLQTKEQVYNKLRSMIDVREVRNTELIQISAMSPDKKEAMDIANRIADEYQRRRISQQQEWVTKSLAQLQDETAKQRAKVEDLREQAAKLRIEFSINDLNPEGVEDTSQTTERVLQSVEEQVSTERLKVASQRAKYDLISKMTDDQIMRSIRSLEIDDPTILQFLPLYQEAASEEARLLNSGLGPNHPSVRSLRAKKDVMEKQLTDQIVVLRKTLESNLSISTNSLAQLEEQLTTARTSQQDTKTRSASYNEAKNNYIQAKKVLEAADMRLSTERMQVGMPQTPTTIWQYAEMSDVPARPKVLLNMALAVVVGLVFGVGLAFFIEYLDTSVKTMEDVEKFLQVPVLAVIPKNISLLINSKADNPDAEAYRILRTNIEFNRKSPEANTVTLVSGGAGEGKSTTLSNLAYTFASGGYTTLIVDADLRRPSIHRIFGVSNEIGLSDYLTKTMTLEDVVVKTNLENLFLLPSGRPPADAVGILNSHGMMELIDEAKNRFDIVFFDSPPILGVSDASVLASSVDLTLIVVQHRRFPKAMLQRVKQSILNVGGNIIGVVVNNVDVRHDQHYEYYTSYYSYYQKPSPTERAASRKSAKAAPAVDRSKKEDPSSEQY